MNINEHALLFQVVSSLDECIRTKLKGRLEFSTRDEGKFKIFLKKPQGKCGHLGEERERFFVTLINFRLW